MRRTTRTRTLVVVLALAGGVALGFLVRALQSPPTGPPPLSAPPGARGDQAAPEGIPIRIDVRAPDGGRAKSARIHLARDATGREDRRFVRWTAVQDSVHLRAGFYWVWAEQEAPLARRSPRRRLVVGPGTSTLLLRLADRRGIRGAIAYPEPVRLPQAHVWALRFDGEAPPEPDAMLQHPDVVRGHLDASASTYTFWDLPRGRYAVAFFLGGRAIGATAVLEVEEGLVEQDLRVAPFTREHFLVLHMLDVDGGPLTDVVVFQHYRDNEITLSRSAVLIERADGAWYIPKDLGVQAGSRALISPDGHLSLTIRSKQSGTTERTYALTAAEDLVVRMREPARATVHLEGFTQRGLGSGARVHLVSHPASPAIRIPMHGVPIDASGRARFQPQQPGEQWVVVVVPTREGPIRAACFALRLTSGPSEHDLTLPVLHSLRVEGAKSDEGAVTLTRLDPSGPWPHQQAKPDVDGLVTFSHVPAGRYRIETHNGPKSRSLEVEVPTRSVVRLP